MDISGKHIAVLVHDFFEQAEFEEPISALKDAGAEVTVISASNKSKSLTGMDHAKQGDTFQADLMLEQASSGDYDALVLPGGAINADHLRTVEAAKQWAGDFLDSGKPLAVICHAPWVLVSADAVEGRRLTSYHTIRDDITNAGGEWVNQPVVIDGNLITSRGPDDLPQFNDAIIRMLSGVQEPAVPGPADAAPPRSEASGEARNRLHAMGYDIGRDGLSPSNAEEILLDEDLDDPDEAHLSGVTPEQERR